MNILHRYVAKIIILTTAFVMLAIVALSFFIGLLGELRDIGTGDYGFLQALVHVFLKLPHDLYLFFPMLIMLGGVLGLGILATHHELLVMRTSGVSIPRVVRAVLTAAFFLIILATSFGECVAPQAMYLADKYKESAENGGQAIATTSGVWIHEGNNFLHIERVIGKYRLEGVKRYEFDAQHHLLSAYYVQSLDFIKGQWHLHNVQQTSFKHNETKSQHLQDGTWSLELNPNLLNVGMVEPEQLSLVKLSRYINHLVGNGLQASRFQFEFWKRIFQPLTTLVMILLAVPFVFAAPRSTMGRRVLFAIITGFTFYILNAFLGQFSVVFQLSPIWAALLPTLLFAGLGYFLMWRLAR